MTTGVPGWDARLPWLRAGTTWRGAGGGPALRVGNADVDGGQPGMVDRPAGADAAPRPAAFLTSKSPDSPWRAVVWSRQVHGSDVRVHGNLPAGETVAADGDGHVTRQPGLLMAVTLADCVPVFLADPATRAVALLHAGWRGTAAGVLEAGVDALARAMGSDPGDLLAHLGPAICGECYEVGPEVFEAVGEEAPHGPAPIDLRAVLAQRAIAVGIRPERLTVSRECTLCGDGRYFSHRRGDSGRHLGYLGIVEGDDLRSLSASERGCERSERKVSAAEDGRRSEHCGILEDTA